MYSGYFLFQAETDFGNKIFNQQIIKGEQLGLQKGEQRGLEKAVRYLMGGYRTRKVLKDAANSLKKRICCYPSSLVLQLVCGLGDPDKVEAIVEASSTPGTA